MKWLLTILLIGSLYGQGFGYNYIDPCNQQAVNLNYKTETTENGFWVTYYNQRRFFTWLEVADGTLQNWTQQVYRYFERLFPCAVNIAEEALASASTINLADELEREDEEDIGPKMAQNGTKVVSKWLHVGAKTAPRGPKRVLKNNKNTKTKHTQEATNPKSPHLLGPKLDPC